MLMLSLLAASRANTNGPPTQHHTTTPPHHHTLQPSRITSSTSPSALCLAPPPWPVRRAPQLWPPAQAGPAHSEMVCGAVCHPPSPPGCCCGKGPAAPTHPLRERECMVRERDPSLSGGLPAARSTLEPVRCRHGIGRAGPPLPLSLGSALACLPLRSPFARLFLLLHSTSRPPLQASHPTKLRLPPSRHPIIHPASLCAPEQRPQNHPVVSGRPSAAPS